MSKVEINSLYSFGKSIKKMSEEEQVTALNDYLVQNNLTIDIARRFLDLYSLEHKLDFTNYAYGMYANMFAGYVFGAYFGLKHQITGVIVLSIACILVRLDFSKRLRLKNVDHIRFVLDEIEYDSEMKN